MIRRRGTLLVFGLVAICCLFASDLAHASGYYYEATTTTTAQGKKRDDQMKVLAWVDGDKAKVQFVSHEKKGMFAEGGYLVTTDGGETVYLVNPKEKTYSTFDMEAMMSAVGQVIDTMNQMGGMMKMEFTDIHNELLLEESGDSILGHSTTHYRYKSGYTMNLKVMGMRQRSTSESIQDLWSTEDLAARGFGVWLRPDRNMRTGNEEFDKLINQEMSKIKGFPLKSVVVSTTTNKKGKSQQVTATTSVDLLREESIADGTFGWPDDYTEIEFIPEMQGDDAQGGQGKKKKGGLGSLFGG